MKISNNEKELFLVFIPNIVFGFLFELYEKNLDSSNFIKENQYFKNLYVSKLICLAVFILAQKFLRTQLPKYSVVITAYLFNILLIISDITNIGEYIETKKDFENSDYYKTFNMRVYVNYIFLAIWMIIILAKVKKWIKKLKSCDIEAKEHQE